jgi:hypothetical protein
LCSPLRICAYMHWLYVYSLLYCSLTVTLHFVPKYLLFSGHISTPVVLRTLRTTVYKVTCKVGIALVQNSAFLSHMLCLPSSVDSS